MKKEFTYSYDRKNRIEKWIRKDGTLLYSRTSDGLVIYYDKNGNKIREKDRDNNINFYDETGHLFYCRTYYGAEYIFNSDDIIIYTKYPNGTTEWLNEINITKDINNGITTYYYNKKPILYVSDDGWETYCNNGKEFYIKNSKIGEFYYDNDDNEIAIKLYDESIIIYNDCDYIYSKSDNCNEYWYDENGYIIHYKKYDKDEDHYIKYCNNNVKFYEENSDGKRIYYNFFLCHYLKIKEKILRKKNK